LPRVDCGFDLVQQREATSRLDEVAFTQNQVLRAKDLPSVTVSMSFVNSLALSSWAFRESSTSVARSTVYHSLLAVSSSGFSLVPSLA
jgi:hypothetical protein